MPISYLETVSTLFTTEEVVVNGTPVVNFWNLISASITEKGEKVIVIGESILVRPSVTLRGRQARPITIISQKIEGENVLHNETVMLDF